MYMLMGSGAGARAADRAEGELPDTLHAPDAPDAPGAKAAVDDWYQRVEAAGVFMSADQAAILLDEAPPMADVALLSALLVLNHNIS